MGDMRGAGWLARDRELAAVGRLLDEPAPGPRGLLIEGEPGIGKTTVCTAAMELAGDRGYLVLATRGSQSETGLSFAGLTDLLDEAADVLVHELPEPQRIALEVALARRMPGSATVGQREVGMAVLAVLRRLCEHRRVLIVLDDVSWVDSPTVEAVRFALRRMRTEPIRVLGTLRLDQVASAVWREIPVDELRLEPLSAGAIEQLLSTRLDLTLPPRVLRALVERTAGNPFWALEVGRALVRQPGDPTIDLPLPASLIAVVTDRLAGLDSATRAALIAVSALAYPTISLTLQALDGVVANPGAALDAAVTVGVVVETSGKLRPAHPLLGYAALEALPPGGRSALHRRLAEIVKDPEQRARHMAVAAEPPDAEVAVALDEGAAVARARGATAAAAELVELAVDFTPPDDRQASCRRSLEAAEVLYAVGEPERAARYAEAHDPADMPPDLRRRSLPFLAELTYWGRGAPAAQELIRRTIAGAGDDQHLSAVALAMASDVGDGRGGNRAEFAAQAIALFDSLDEDPDPAALATALIYLADASANAGDGIQESQLRRAEEVQQRLPWMPVTTRASTTRGYLLKVVDDLDGSRTELNRAIATARDEGEDGALPALFGHLALTECWAGRYAESTQAVDEGLRRITGSVPAVLHATNGLLKVLTGDLAAARALMEHEFEVEGVDIVPRKAIVYRQVLGAVALLSGDDEQAVDVLTTALDMARAEGIHEPGRRQRLEGDLGQALVNTDRLGDAAKLATELRALGAALAAAFECFTTLGAEPFARLAEAELARVQAARVGGALTKTESKIAELVATGLTNREVASQLFASVRTVEGHLAAVYRKLGIRSRTELARFLADHDSVE